MAVTFALVTASRAQAAPSGDQNTDEGASFAPDRAPDTFRYEGSDPKTQYVRAVLEGASVWSLGLLEYLTSTEPVRGQLEPSYDWNIFRDKLSGNTQSFDKNQFNTNFIGHPLGGTMYYLSARSNRLSIAEASLWAFSLSTAWEYIGEIEEKPSYNDLIVTPTAGIATGETLTQLGSFLARSRPTLLTTIVRSLLDPLRTLHDQIDGLDPERAPAYDDLGFAADRWHQFQASLAPTFTVQRSTTGAGGDHGYFDTAIRLSGKIINLPDVDGIGRHDYAFSDGNMAELTFRAMVGESGLSDALFTTRMMPVGFYRRRGAIDASGKLRGETFLVGPMVGYEYGMHDYDRDRRQRRDQVGLVNLGGPTFEYRMENGPLRFRSALDTGLDFAGVHSYGLPAYLTSQRIEDLSGVIGSEGYYFAWGVTVAPRAEVWFGPFGLGAGARFDRFEAILGLDDSRQLTQTKNVSRFDRRGEAHGWLAMSLLKHWKLEVSAFGRERSGTVGNAGSHRSERGVSAMLGAVF